MAALLANPAVLLAAIVLAAMLTFPYEDEGEALTDCVVCDGVGCEFCPRVES